MNPDVAASVRDRLENKGRKMGRPFAELLQYYGLERFLFRLAESRHRDRFILKGALTLRVWGAPATRPPRDIDFLARGDNSPTSLARATGEICQIRVPDDRVVFDSGTVSAERIMEGVDYEGVRVRFLGFLDKFRIPMQLDIGFGDVVLPGVEEKSYPALLESTGPILRIYPREAVIAEKLQAMVVLGTLNSRMKDFFDIWLLARHFDFSGADLSTSIAATFQNRGTAIDPDPVALSPAFTALEPSQRQWEAFVRRTQLVEVPGTLDEVCGDLRHFLHPVALSIAEGSEFTSFWRAPGPWTSV